MSEDFLFTDGTNPSALLDILDDNDRWAKSILKYKTFVNRFIQMLIRVLRMYSGAIKFNKHNVPISLKRLHSIMSGGCKIIEMASGQIKIIPNSWKYKNEIFFVLNIFFDRLTIGNNITGCSTWTPKQQPNCNMDFVILLNCLFKEQEYEFEKLLHFFKQNSIGQYRLDSELKDSELLQQVIAKFRNNTFQ